VFGPAARLPRANGFKMSDENTIEEQAPAAVEMELETGRLLPVWLTTLIYAFGLPWCAFAIVYIIWASVVQHKVVSAVDLIAGKEGPVLSLSDPRMKEAVQLLSQNPKDGLLYILEELQQREIENPNMAKALALAKALRWGTDSARRQLFEELLSHMNLKGEFEEGYVLPEEHARTLRELIEERKAAALESYEEKKITEVLEWVAAGHKTPPKGPEYRRLMSLKTKYEKRRFQGKEIKALEDIIELWEQKQESVYQEIVAQFRKMLQGAAASLSPEARAICEENRRLWEDKYLAGRANLAEVAYQLLEKILQERIFIDHPPIYVMIRLLDHRHKPVRESMAKCVMLLRKNRFTIEYLADAAKQATVNPVMAVETETMTQEEHEVLLIEANKRRRREAVKLLTEIALEWCRMRAETGQENPFGLKVMDARKFFKDNVVEVFREIADHKDVKDLAQESIARLRAGCSDYFE